ncbi:MAG: hypothetical protein K0Q51_1453, partial [Rickettsiaceae bacterium]|nr:hypothetical protein [Rickettsiaceae bacterium]
PSPRIPKVKASAVGVPELKANNEVLALERETPSSRIPKVKAPVVGVPEVKANNEVLALERETPSPRIPKVKASAVGEAEVKANKPKLDNTNNTNLKHGSTNRFMFEYLDLLTDSIASRLSYLSKTIIQGFAAGEEGEVERRVWFKGLFNSTKHKDLPVNDSIFDTKHKGFTLGLDAEVKDNFILGGSYSYIASEASLRLATDKTLQESRIHTFGLYNQYLVNEKFTINSYLSYGKAFIKYDDQSENRSKTKGNIVRLKVEGLRHTKIGGGISLIPKLGLSADYIWINAFEDRSSSVKQRIAKRRSNKHVINLGLKLEKLIEFNDFAITPSVHFNIDHAMRKRNSKINFIKENLSTTSAEPMSPIRNICNVGAALNIQRKKRISFDIGYDHSCSRGFKSHTAYVSCKLEI